MIVASIDKEWLQVFKSGKTKIAYFQSNPF